MNEKRKFLGREWPKHWLDWHCRLWMFGNSKGHEKFLHFKELVKLLWPEPLFLWDEWADLFFMSLCGDKEGLEQLLPIKIETEEKWWTACVSTGAASTGKSSKSAMWILCCWLCAQDRSTVVLTSTSLDQLKRRIWSELCEWISKCKVELPLEIVASDTEIRYKKGDKKNAIFGIAVKSGGVPQEAVDRIKGIHNRRVFVVVDEMTSVPTAIIDACSNLNKGTLEFQFIGLGNALRESDPHGVHCEPLNGYASTTVDDQFWLTKKGGCCIHFDGHRSPALRDPDKYHFYIKKVEMDEDRKKFGGENTPEYWTNDRGYWPPIGLSKTVFDDALLTQFKTNEPAVWKSAYRVCAGFDPAFEGGDRRILQPFKMGEFPNGSKGIEILPPIHIAIDMSQDKRWIHYQIADAIIEKCRELNIDPDDFAMDTSGEGGGLFSVLSGRWSPNIHAVEFGGAASDEVISIDRPVTYRELYGNRVTMLWYVLRRFMEGGQIRGLTDPETRTELTTRKYEHKSGRIHVEPKSKMKLVHRSPDKADALCVASELLRMKGVVPAGNTGGGSQMDMEAWNKKAQRIEITDEEEMYDYAF